MTFNAKVIVIEEMDNIKYLNMDQLLGTLTSYEMRVGIEKSEPKEAMLKVSRKGKEHKDHQDCPNCDSDQELTQLARTLKCGLGKYKGKFPFKC